MIVVAQRILAQSTTGCIFVGQRESGDTTRVNIRHTNNAAAITVGATYAVDGDEGVYEDRWGRSHSQIVARSVERQHVTGQLLRPWLERLPHLGPVRAQRLLEAFGSELLTVLSDPDALERVALAIEPDRQALAQRIAFSVMAATASQGEEESSLVAEARFLAVLESHGVEDGRAAKRLWRLVGSKEGEARLLANPYMAAAILSWNQADHLGQRLLQLAGDDTDPRRHEERLLGALDSSWRTVLENGDTAISRTDLRRELQRRDVNAEAVFTVADRKGLLVHSAEDHLRAPGAAWIENDLADRLHKLASSRSRVQDMAPAALDVHIRAVEQTARFQLTEEQRDAVRTLLARPVAVLQGGAGVGKTAVTTVLAGVWEALGGNCVLTALSGKAALQLSRGASAPGRPRIAFTAARLLSLLKKREESAAAGEVPPADMPKITSDTLLVVDEASMMDTPTLRDLVEKLVLGCQLLCVGDHGQLPSVGIGRVFHDLVEDGRCVSTLNTILRQQKDSQIPRAAADVRVGRVPTLDLFTGQQTGIFLVEASDRRASLAAWQNTYRTLCDATERSKVLAVAALTSSVNWLNLEASTERRRRESAPTALRLGPYAAVTVGDPVICRQNRYASGLFNGMMGIVTALESESKIRVAWEGEAEERDVESEDFGDIGLAYAITCHKSQGSAADAVVILVESTRLITREWVYTAITRARRLVVLVGTGEVLRAAVARRTERRTGFRLHA